MRRRWLPIAVFAAVLLLYGATLQRVEYSDGVHIAAMVGGPAPERYYNWLYVFVGWTLHKTLGAALHWTTWRTLGVLSALCGAATAALLVRHLAARTPGRAGAESATAWTALVVLTPGTWFFCTTVEVHSMQLLGCTAATLIALHARTVPTRRAVALVVGAAVLALLAHLTSVLLVPTLIALALPPRGARPGVGLALRPLPLAAGAAAGALLLYGALVLGHADRMLFEYARLFLERFRGDRLFSPREVLGYAHDEILLTMALLLLAIPLGLAVRRDPDGERARHLLRALLVAAVPFLFVLTQGGIREQGAYYLGLYGTTVLLGAEAGRLVERRLGARRGLVPACVLLAAAGQGALAWRAIDDYNSGPRAVDWAQHADELCLHPGYVFVSTLPRYHAIARVAGLEGSDLRRDLELVPERGLRERTLVRLQIAIKQLTAGAAVYFDADLFRADAPERVQVLTRPLKEILASAPGRLDPVPADAARPLLYRLVLPPPKARDATPPAATGERDGD